MEENEKVIESLIEKATDYGKTSYELVKLKALEKTTDVVSSAVPYSIVFVSLAIFLTFFSFGLAYFLGYVFGNTYLGFFAVAGLYAIVGLIVYYFLYDWMKESISNGIIRKVLK
jgi:hypothetical protein